MPDRNKVIWDIGRCICHVPDACRDCSKFSGISNPKCIEDLMADALELLKEQEQEPIHDSYHHVFKCGNCLEVIKGTHFNYCPNCGKKIKWG